MDIIKLASVTSSQDAKEMNTANRIDNAARQYKNLLNTNIKDTLILAGGTAAAGGTAFAVSKSKIAQNIISKGTSKVASIGKEVIKKLGNKKFISNAVNWVKNLPGPAKFAGAVVGLITFGLIKHNENKGIFQSGRILQENVDKSKIEERILK